MSSIANRFRAEKMISNLLLFVVAVIGMTHILVDPSVIAVPLRNWLAKNAPAWVNKLFSCYQCCGTWVGFLFGFILISYNPLVVFACGMAGSFLATWGATYLNYLEAQSLVNLDENK